MGSGYVAQKPIAKSKSSAASRRVSQNKSPNLKNPPSNIPTLIIKNHRLRFLVNASGGTVRGIDDIDLLDLFCVATSATSASRILDGILVKKIEMWAANSAGNASNTVQCEFLNQNVAGIGGPGWIYNDTAIGLTDVCSISCVPPRDSKLGSWITGFSSTNLFELTCPQGCVVDIVADLVLMESETPSAVTGAVASATAGKLYCRPLDSTNATPVLLPVGFDYI